MRIAIAMSDDDMFGAIREIIEDLNSQQRYLAASVLWEIMDRYNKLKEFKGEEA